MPALWCPRAQVFLNVENRDLDYRNLRSELKISYTACPCLSQSISVQFALELSHSPKSPKIYKKPLFWCWKSSKINALGANRKRVYDFLLVINSIGPILHRFWDTAIYWLKSQFFISLLFSAFAQCDPFQIYGNALRFLKLESSRQPTVKILSS